MILCSGVTIELPTVDGGSTWPRALLLSSHARIPGRLLRRLFVYGDAGEQYEATFERLCCRRLSRSRYRARRGVAQGDRRRDPTSGGAGFAPHGSPFLSRQRVESRGRRAHQQVAGRSDARRRCREPAEDPRPVLPCAGPHQSGSAGPGAPGTGQGGADARGLDELPGQGSQRSRGHGGAGRREPQRAAAPASVDGREANGARERHLSR